MKPNPEKVKLLSRNLRDGREYPRSPRETLAGYVLAARAVDKMPGRAHHNKAGTIPIVHWSFTTGSTSTTWRRNASNENLMRSD
jgi:hypothetical protein